MATDTLTVTLYFPWYARIVLQTAVIAYQCGLDIDIWRVADWFIDQAKVAPGGRPGSV